MMRIKEKLCEQSGAAAVEFAILLIFLVMLLFGIIEFSVVLYNQAVITNASREGARKGIVFTGLCDVREDPVKVQQIVLDYCDEYLISRVDGTEPQVPSPVYKDPDGNTISDPTCGDVLIVDVEYDYDFFVLPWLPIPGDAFDKWRPGIKLTARAIMRLE